jgi:hypothetical protein
VSGTTPLLNWRPRDFDGTTYEPARDRDRLFAQLADVKAFMADGQWHTLGEIAAATGHPQASVSARLRDLRRLKHGGYDVQKRHIKNGLWEYRCWHL